MELEEEKDRTRYPPGAQPRDTHSLQTHRPEYHGFCLPSYSPQIAIARRCRITLRLSSASVSTTTVCYNPLHLFYPDGKPLVIYFMQARHALLHENHLPFRLRTN
jgi:hypothetical protein